MKKLFKTRISRAKKLFTLMFTILVTLETMSAVIGPKKIGDLYYYLDDDTYCAEVTSDFGAYTHNSDSYDSLTTANIPTFVTYNGQMYNVTSIKSKAFYFTAPNLMSVTIPNSVLTIGESAFVGHNSLSSLTIGNSVINIGKSAFGGCSSLTSVGIPNSVICIGSSAFASCTGLLSVEIPNRVDSIKDKTFEYCNGLTSVFIPGSVVYIGNSAFRYCTSLMSVTIPNSVVTIGECAFQHSGLKSVEIPNSVDSIKDAAFQYCDSLISVFIPSSVVYIGKGAFNNSVGSSKLTKVSLLSNRIVSQDYKLYSNLNNLFGHQVKEYIIGDGVTRIGNYAFHANDSLQSIVLPNNSLTSIGEGSFYNCYNLQSITIPASVSSIEKRAFSNCRSLTSMHIPDSIMDIKISTFYGCEKLTSIKIPDNVVSVGEQSFRSCVALTSVSMGSRVANISQYAFANCTSLDTVYNNAPIPQIINRNVFDAVDISNVHLIVPKGSVELYKAADVWKDFIIEEYCEPMHGMCGDNLQWSLSCDSMRLTIKGIGQMYNYESGTTPWYEYRDVIKSVSLSSEITYIGSFAFADCPALESVYIPNMVASIGQQAFSNCTGLQSITCLAVTPPLCGMNVFLNVDKTIPLHVVNNSVSSYRIADQWEEFFDAEYRWCIAAYGMCGDNLQWVINCDTTEMEITGYGSMDDYELSNTSPWYAYRNKLQKIYLSKNLTYIGDFAFCGCDGLTSVSIGSGVTSIGNYAFSYCGSLDTIYNYSLIPQTIQENVFNGVNKSNCALIVSEESVALYKAADVWKDFFPQDDDIHDGITVRLDPNSCSDWNSVYLYSWINNGTVQPCGGWPGTQVTRDADGWWSYTFDSSIENVNIIWNNGQGAQTVDIVNVSESTCYALDDTYEVGMYGNSLRNVNVVNCPTNETDPGENYHHVRIGNLYYDLDVENGTAKVVGVVKDTISVTDHSLADWDQLPEDYVFEAVCPEDADLLGLKSVKVYADQTYIYVLVEPNMDDITDLSYVPFDVIIDTDNSDATDGYVHIFTDDNADILTEGALFADDAPYNYNPAVYKWWGEAGDASWGWIEGAVMHSDEDCYGALICEGSLPIGQSQYVNGKFEIRLNRELIPATWNSSEFGIGFGILQSWNYVGVLPLGVPTDENWGGYTNKLKVLVDYVEKDNIVIPAYVAYKNRTYNVDGIGSNAFAGCSLQTLTCEAVNPPVCENDAFGDMDKSVCSLYVPAQSIDVYRTADQWEDFFTILPIEDSTTTVIDTISGDSSLVTRKVIIDGQILILRGDKVYTVTGQEVR